MSTNLTIAAALLIAALVKSFLYLCLFRLALVCKDFRVSLGHNSRMF